MEKQIYGQADQALTEEETPKIRARTMELLLSAGFFPSAMHIIVVLIVAFVLSPANSPWFVIPWVLAFAATLGAQALLTARFGGRRLETAEAAAANRRFNITQLSIGLLWGLCGAFMFPEQDFGRALLLVFVMGGMAMSAVATQHANLRFCIFQIILGVVPLAINYTISDLPFGQLSGFFLFLYLMVLISLAIRQHRFARKAIDLQIVQERLLKQLSEQADELKQARILAEEANASKSRFLAQSSHDLRQPLHAISLFVESLPSLKNPKQHDMVLSKIRQSLDILTKLFDSLLDVTMLDTGGIEVKNTSFRLQDIMDQVASDFGLIAEANGVELRTGSSSAVVMSDPVLLRRLLQNLLSNAIQHAAGSQTLIGCKKRDGTISLIVADNGSGIDPQDQKRIFAEFERLDAARMGKAAGPGLGLGLSIVRRLATKMGLTVSLSSASGKLTIFEISGLKLSNGAELLAQPKTQALNENLLDGLRVFIVDDNVDSLEAMQLLLEKWGCDVAAGKNISELPSDSPDMIICDYELDPDFNGLDVLEGLNAAHGAKIPAIMISGHNSKEFRTKIGSLGLPLLHKPLRPAPLRSAMLNMVAENAVIKVS